MNTHHMTVTSDDGAEMLLECPEEYCGRRVVVKRSSEIVVIDQGDFFARHAGGNGPVTVDIAV